MTLKDVAQIIDMRRRRYTASKIERLTGWSAKRVIRALKKAGIPVIRIPPSKNKRSPKTLTVSGVTLALRSGMTMPEIARKMGVTYGSLASFMVINNLTALNSNLVLLPEMAGELGLNPDTLSRHIKRGTFKASRHGKLWGFNLEQARAVREHYKTLKQPEDYDHWLTTAEAAMIFGITPAALMYGRENGTYPTLNPVRLRGAGNPLRWNPDEIYAVQAIRREKKRRREANRGVRRPHRKRDNATTGTGTETSRAGEQK